MKIALITAGGLNGRRLAHLLHHNQVDFELLTVSYPKPKRRKQKRTKFYKKLLRNRLSNVQWIRNLKMRNLPTYPIKEKFLGSLNEKRMHDYLRNLAPDYILMMGGGILKDKVIATATKGVLNAHPGILPYIRGLDAIKHSILQDTPIGVTGHFINPGIDTGDIIDRFWLPITSQHSLPEIIENSNHLSVAVMANLVFKILDGKVLERIPQEKKFPLCRKLKGQSNNKVLEKLSQGWNNVHEAKIMNMDFLGSGTELFRLYDQWWPKEIRF